MVHFDATLGRYPYTGFKTGGERPIARDAVRAAGIEVVVAGRRYGKGSSREHSVVAEAVGRRAAGDRRELRAHLPPERRQRRPVHVAPTSASSSASSAARRSRSTSCSPAATRWPRRSCARAGCSPTASAAAARAAAQPAAADAAPGAAHAVPEDRRSPHAGHRRHAGAARARPRRLRARRLALHPRVLHRHVRAPAAAGVRRRAGAARAGEHRRLRGPPVVRAPQPGARGAGPGRQRARRCRARTAPSSSAIGLTHHGYLQPQLDAGDDGNTGSQGISHAMVAERYALPGQLIVGTDSHTPHSGALGCVAFGVGTTDMANAFVTGAVRLDDARVAARRARRARCRPA